MTAAPIEPRLLPDESIVEDRDVLIGGVSLSALADEHGTPLFVYDEATIRARCREAAIAFDDAAYAAKAFLCGTLARVVAEEGLRIDVATEGELDLVLRAGVDASRIVVHGNNKSPSELARAIDAGVHRVVVDNLDEIGRLARVAGRSAPVSCLLRVVPGVEAHTHEFVRTGQEDTKFGLSISRGDAAVAAARLAAVPGVALVGLHAHVGSQIFELGAFEATVEACAGLLGELGLGELCVGGGLGVAYVTGEESPTIPQWGAALRAAAARHLPAGTVVSAEPGRSIIARAAVTVYRVGAIKATDARTYLVVDGGMSDNPRPVLYGSGYEAFALAAPRAARDATFRIVGKHCESGDVLIEDGDLPSSVAVDDYVVTPVTGAYGYSMASNYNRVPRPAVVFVADGRARVALRRESLDDLARLESPM
jgi:diaminopimelate decarboxylase